MQNATGSSVKQVTAPSAPSKKRPAPSALAKPAPKQDTGPGWGKRIETFLVRQSRLVFAVLLMIASARVVMTYDVFSITTDEPMHIACGMEWLSKGVYNYEAQHPPLARVMGALLPYLDGARSLGRPKMWDEGMDVLTAGNQYDKRLALARLGVLPFFWLATWVIYAWTKRGFGEPTALLATFLFTFLPPVLAHAGLATTDMGLTATFGAAFLSMLIWAETPTWKWSIVFGLSLAAAVLSKFSVLAFLPSATIVALIIYTVIERPSRLFVMNFVNTRAAGFALASCVAAVIIWSGYRFSFSNHVPAPELFKGIQDVMQHNAEGHKSYLLGKFSDNGWWYYYLVLLAVKTPLALLALLGVGAMVCWKNRRQPGGRYWIPVAFALGILIFASVFSRINIGLRHVLPVYFGLCIVAAVGARHLFTAKTAIARWVAASLLLWMGATSILSHPDYLPYFNALAGDEPEKIVVDSDLDWGQDVKRLLARLKQLGVKGISFNQPTPQGGWNAVSFTFLKLKGMGLYETNPQADPWPNHFQPTERVGKSVLLYYFPPSQ